MIGTAIVALAALGIAVGAGALVAPPPRDGLRDLTSALYRPRTWPASARPMPHPDATVRPIRWPFRGPTFRPFRRDRICPYEGQQLSEKRASYDSPVVVRFGGVGRSSDAFPHNHVDT
jgi:hypothetical protein